MARGRLARGARAGRPHRAGTEQTGPHGHSERSEESHTAPWRRDWNDGPRFAISKITSFLRKRESILFRSTMDPRFRWGDDVLCFSFCWGWVRARLYSRSDDPYTFRLQ